MNNKKQLYELMRKQAQKSINYIESLKFLDDKSKLYSFNAMEHWYPRIGNIPTPLTASIPFSFYDVLRETEQNDKSYTNAVGIILKKYLEKFPNQKAFLRLSQTSSKFAGKNYVDADNIINNLIDILIDSCMGSLPNSNYIFLREIIEPNNFGQLSSGTKINAEYRFFISIENNKPKIISNFNYWKPNEKMDDETRLKLEQHEKSINLDPIIKYIENGQYKDIHGEWSLDFMQDIHGNWFLIDCALAKDSYNII